MSIASEVSQAAEQNHPNTAISHLPSNIVNIICSKYDSKTEKQVFVAVSRFTAVSKEKLTNQVRNELRETLFCTPSVDPY